MSNGAQYREILLPSRLVELDGRKKQVRHLAAIFRDCTELMLVLSLWDSSGAVVSFREVVYSMIPADR